ncbi:hypothetical protein FRC17_005069 [Serendipita sp. 399]|nr:hypothetical protein FRC17_005069 [Serendipita sp. 399]
MDYFVNEGMTRPHPSSKGIGSGFEKFGAYHLGKVLGTPKRLNDIVTFVENTAIAGMTAQLVALNRMDGVDGGFLCSEVDILGYRWPSHILGRTMASEEDVIGWLNNPRSSAFCFPSETFGPDLVMLLRLSDGKIIRALVQFKHYWDLTTHETRDALTSTDPDKLFATSCSNSKSVLRNASQRALEALGPGTDLAGPYGVLRLLVVYPAAPDKVSLVRLFPESSSYPIGIVDWNSLPRNGIATRHPEVIGS